MAEKHEEVYDDRAVAYDRLVAREDWEGHLLPAIREIVDLSGLAVVESGAGTGRVTRLIAPHVVSIQAFERAQAMIDQAKTLMTDPVFAGVTWGQATHDALPVESGAADLSIAGWSVCYCATWGGETWAAQVDAAIEELHRVCHDEGTCILIETLGTGAESPTPPDTLAPYFERLESHWGFTRYWIRTDYRFESRQEAAELLEFFFGEERAAKALASHDASGAGPDDPLFVPECTGLWWRRGPLPARH